MAIDDKCVSLVVAREDYMSIGQQRSVLAHGGDWSKELTVLDGGSGVLAHHAYVTCRGRPFATSHGSRLHAERKRTGDGS
jgi:hypothetical protein